MDRETARLKRIRMFIWASAGIALLSVVDLSLKWIVADVVMDPPRRISILPFFDLVLVFNRGISFGLLSDMGIWGPRILSGVATAIIGMLFVWLWRAHRTNEVVGITLIIGGAVGNLIDRLHDEAVTDFLNLFIGQYHWPVFNSADVFITVGVLSLFLPNSKGNQDFARNDHVSLRQKEHVTDDKIEEKR